MAYLETTDWGTKKRVPRTTIAGTYTASGTHTINLSSIVPAGTKAITLYIEVEDNVAGTYCQVRETGDANYIWGVHSIAAGAEIDSQGDIQLDSNYTFEIWNSAVMTAVTLRMIGIYM